MSSASAKKSTPVHGLSEDAAYGRLAFDYYVMEQWEYLRPTTEDHQQWSALAKRWLAMDPMNRKHYHEKANNSWLKPQEDMPNQEQILRIFAPHQTVQERNLSITGGNFAWVRTFYGQALAPAYTEMTERYFGVMQINFLIFDNESLYGNVGDNLSGLFERAPQLCSWDSWLDEEDPYDDVEPPEDESRLPLFLAAKKERLIMLLLDAESQQKKLLKIVWFGSNGELLWWNWLRLSDLLDWHGRVIGLGDRLFWVYEISEGSPELWSQGAMILVNT